MEVDLLPKAEPLLFCICPSAPISPGLFGISVILLFPDLPYGVQFVRYFAGCVSCQSHLVHFLIFPHQDARDNFVDTFPNSEVNIPDLP